MEEASDPDREKRLIAVHVCQKCEAVYSPSQVNEDVNVTGVVQCKACGHIGPLHIRIVNRD